MNTTKPSVDLVASGPSVLLSISVLRLVERGPNLGIVSELGLGSSDLNFSYVPSPLLGSSNSTNNTMWVYSTQLVNKAVINITVSSLLLSFLLFLATSLTRYSLFHSKMT